MNYASLRQESSFKVRMRSGDSKIPKRIFDNFEVLDAHINIVNSK